MKLLFVYDCLYPETVGGVEHRNRELGMALGRRGHDVTLAGWTRSSAPLPRQEGFRTLRMHLSGPIADETGRRLPAAAARFAVASAALRVADYDVVETANIPYLHVFSLAARCRAARVPFVVSWYEYWGDYFGVQFGQVRGRSFAAIERKVAEFGTVCCAVSALTASRLARTRGTEVPVIPAGIHFGRLDAVRRSTPKEAASIVYAGRLIEEKRVSILLQAFAAVLAELPAATLTLVGDGPERARLETLARSLGVSGRVRFLGRLPDSTDVFRVVAGASIAVQLSQREGFGMFPLEAMALGAPLVHCASAESALGELVDADTGLCVSPEPPSVAEAIVKLLRDPALMDRMSAHAVERARAYDWNKVAERFEGLVSGLSRGSA